MQQSIGSTGVWEDLISRNPPEGHFEVLGPARDYRDSDSHPTNWDAEDLPLASALARDTYPIPSKADREGYYGENHFSYWASGLRDTFTMLRCARSHGVEVAVYLDIGCASGRVLRHFAINSSTKRIIGCDINKRHIDWIATYLPLNIEVFQNTSVPTLQLEDSSVDLISCFSVFTHIENFDSAWIMEIRRILKPGGLAWITFLSERHWIEVKEEMPRYRNWFRHPEFVAARKDAHRRFDRLVFRQRNDRSYSSIVFYNTNFLCKRWGRALDVLEVRRSRSVAQDVMVMQKPLSP